MVDNGYQNIKNLNDHKRNFPFADLFAEKDNKSHIISIKARNKYEKNGKENLSYKLGKNAYEHAEKACEKFKAGAYWMAIPFDQKTFSIYFGSLTDLGGKKAIPIQKCKDNILGECLVLDKKHYFDWDFFTNKK